MRRLVMALKYWVFHNHLLKRFFRLQQHQLAEQEELVSEVKASRKQLTGELATVIFKLSSISDNLETVLEDMKEKEKHD